MSTNSKPNRERPIIQITLSPEAIGIADELCARRGLSRSAMIEMMLRDEGIRMGMNARDLGSREQRRRGMPHR